MRLLMGTAAPMQIMATIADKPSCLLTKGRNEREQHHGEDDAVSITHMPQLQLN
jgi:hypothetical protein